MQCLYLRRGGRFKLGITAIDEVETPRYQSHGVVSVSTLYESKKNVLYHVCVRFDSCRGSTTENNAQVHSFLVVKQCIATVGLLDDLVFLFLIYAELAVILSRLNGLFLSQLIFQVFHLHVNDVSKIL